MKRLICILFCVFLLVPIYAEDVALNNELFTAISEGNVASVLDLIGRGADVNAKNDAGTPAIIYACQRNQNSIAKTLLEAGADGSATDSNGNNLTAHAIEKSNVYILSLLGSEADLNGNVSLREKNNNLGSSRIVPLKEAFQNKDAYNFIKTFLTNDNIIELNNTSGRIRLPRYKLNHDGIDHLLPLCANSFSVELVAANPEEINYTFAYPVNLDDFQYFRCDSDGNVTCIPQEGVPVLEFEIRHVNIDKGVIYRAYIEIPCSKGPYLKDNDMFLTTNGDPIWGPLSQTDIYVLFDKALSYSRSRNSYAYFYTYLNTDDGLVWLDEIVVELEDNAIEYSKFDEDFRDNEKRKVKVMDKTESFVGDYLCVAKFNLYGDGVYYLESEFAVID